MQFDASTNHRRRQMRVFLITWVAYAGCYLCRKNLSVLIPALSAAGYSDMQLANLLFGLNLFYFLGQFSSGVLADRVGPVLVVGIGMFTSALSNLTMGLSVSVSALFVLSCVNGAGQSATWSGLVKIMASWFGLRERGVVMGWWCTNYVLGGFIATSFAAYVTYQMPWFKSLNFKRGFIVPAAALMAITVVFVSMTRSGPADRDNAEEVVGAESNPLQLSLGRWRFLRIVLANPSVWVMSTAYLFLKLTRYILLFWLPYYMTSRLGYSAAQAGYTSSLYELAGFPGALIAGSVSDRWMQARRFPVLAMMTWGLGIVLLVYPLAAERSFMAGAVGIALAGLLTYGPDTLISGAASQDAGAGGGTATAAGFICGIGSIGQFLSGYVATYVKGSAGWTALFVWLAAFCLCGGLLFASKWNHKVSMSDSG